MVFLFPVDFFERRACILAFKLAFYTGAVAASFIGAAGLTPTTGFLIGDFDASAWGLATTLAWAGLAAAYSWAGLAATFAGAGLAIATGLAAGAGLATVAGLATATGFETGAGLAAATWATFYGAATTYFATGTY